MRKTNVVPDAAAQVTIIIEDDALRMLSAKDAVESRVLVVVRLKQLEWSEVLEQELGWDLGESEGVGWLSCRDMQSLRNLQRPSGLLRYLDE